MRRLQGYLAGGARRQDIVHNLRWPPQSLLREYEVPASRAEWLGPNRSTIDIMLVIRRLQELEREKLVLLYANFIDLIEAHDSVDRTLL